MSAVLLGLTVLLPSMGFTVTAVPVNGTNGTNGTVPLPAMAEIFTLPNFEGSSTVVAIQGNCTSLREFPSLDKSIRSIQISKFLGCVQLYTTYDCTDTFFPVMGNDIIDLGDWSGITSSIGICSTECPPKTLFPGFPSLLRIDFDSPVEGGEGFYVHVNIGECSRLPNITEEHSMWLIDDSEDNDDGVTLDTLGKPCIEVYEDANCTGTSIQLTKDKVLHPATPILSISLCDYKCRRGLNFTQLPQSNQPPSFVRRIEFIPRDPFSSVMLKFFGGVFTFFFLLAVCCNCWKGKLN